MTFEIKKGEPIPEGRAVGITHTMRRLRIGDSFVIPGENARKGLYSIAKRIGIRITTRKVNGDIQVWRIADSLDVDTIQRIDAEAKAIRGEEIAEEIDTEFDFGG